MLSMKVTVIFDFFVYVYVYEKKEILFQAIKVGLGGNC